MSCFIHWRGKNAEQQTILICFPWWEELIKENQPKWLATSGLGCNPFQKSCSCFYRKEKSKGLILFPTTPAYVLTLPELTELSVAHTALS